MRRGGRKLSPTGQGGRSLEPGGSLLR
jgi:hypothetical protein